jgi:hypothetical protein
MELLEGDGTVGYQNELEQASEVEPAVRYRRALSHIKAFRTRVTRVRQYERLYGHQGPFPSFRIVEYSQQPELRTKTGKTLTVDDIQQLADEAEYDEWGD